MKTRSAMDETARQPAASDGVLVDAEWLEAHLHDPGCEWSRWTSAGPPTTSGTSREPCCGTSTGTSRTPIIGSLDTAAAERLLARSGIARTRRSCSTVRARHGFLALSSTATPTCGSSTAHATPGGRGPRGEQPARRARARRLRPSRTRRTAPGRPCGGARRNRQSGQHPRRRAHPGRVPGRAVLALRRPGAGRPRRPRPLGGPPAHRRPVRRPRVVLAAADLRGVFSAVDLDGEDELITYCTIGGRACTAWFVLSYLLGRDHVRVYDGSWAEWGRMADAPVEQS